MPYPKHLINDNETVALDLRPHWWFFSRHILTGVPLVIILIVVLSETVERNQRKRIPAMASVYFTLAKAHLALDELVEALDALKSAFAIDVRTAELAMLLGQVAFDLDDLKAAERAFVAVTFASKMDAAGTEVSGTTKATALFHLATMAQLRGDLVTARRWASAC